MRHLVDDWASIDHGHGIRGPGRTRNKGRRQDIARGLQRSPLQAQQDFRMSAQPFNAGPEGGSHAGGKLAGQRHRDPVSCQVAASSRPHMQRPTAAETRGFQ